MPETSDMSDDQQKEIYDDMLRKRMREIGAKGKKIRWAALTKEQRSKHARKMAKARWAKKGDK